MPHPDDGEERDCGTGASKWSSRSAAVGLPEAAAFLTFSILDVVHSIQYIKNHVHYDRYLPPTINECPFVLGMSDRDLGGQHNNIWPPHMKQVILNFTSWFKAG